MHDKEIINAFVSKRAWGQPKTAEAIQTLISDTVSENANALAIVNWTDTDGGIRRGLSACKDSWWVLFEWEEYGPLSTTWLGSLPRVRVEESRTYHPRIINDEGGYSEVYPAAWGPLDKLDLVHSRFPGGRLSVELETVQPAAREEIRERLLQACGWTRLWTEPPSPLATVIKPRVVTDASSERDLPIQELVEAWRDPIPPGDEVTEAVSALRRYLNAGGQLLHSDGLTLLRAAWDDLSGSGRSSMAVSTLWRIEEPNWADPILTFVVERDGGSALGSTRAELQRWVIDLETQTADPVDPDDQMAEELAPHDAPALTNLVAEIVEKIECSEDDPLLKWSKDRTKVRVLAAAAINPNGGWLPKQTADDQRKRLRAGLLAEPPRGWYEYSPGRWMKGIAD